MAKKNREPRRTARQFDDDKALTPANRNINTAGKSIHPGEPISKDDTTREFRLRLWTKGRAVYMDDFSPVDIEKPAEPQAKEEAPQDMSDNAKADDSETQDIDADDVGDASEALGLEEPKAEPKSAKKSKGGKKAD